MTVRLPVPDRPDAGTVLVSEWLVGTPDRQSAAIDALHAGWAELATTEGFLSLTSFAAHDGDRILNYAQWTDDAAHRAFTRVDRPELIARVDAAVGDIERPGVQRYRHYRGRDLGTEGEPGCIVIVRFDTDSTATARKLADTVISRQAPIVAGGHHAHFHIRADGRGVFNYAAFTAATDHAAALDTRAMTAPDGIRAAIAAIPGVEGLGYTRYEPRRSLVNPEVG